MHLFHLTLTNLEQILPLEERASFSSLTSALFGERWTADGQRRLHSDQRVFSRVGIDGDRRQEPVSPLFEMLRDDNVRRLCNSFVGANGCSPEKVLVEMSAFYAKNVADRRSIWEPVSSAWPGSLSVPRFQDQIPCRPITG